MPMEALTTEQLPPEPLASEGGSEDVVLGAVVGVRVSTDAGAVDARIRSSAGDILCHRTGLADM